MQFLDSLQTSKTLSAGQQNTHSMLNKPGNTLTVSSLVEHSQYVKQPGNTLRVSRLAAPSQYVRLTRQYLDCQQSRTLTVCQTTRQYLESQQASSLAGPSHYVRLTRQYLTVSSLAEDSPAEHSQYVEQTRQYLDSRQSSRTLSMSNFTTMQCLDSRQSSRTHTVCQTLLLCNTLTVCRLAKPSQ